MADTLTTEQRSRNMSAIKGKDTKPEMIVRKFLHSQGLRFRLHRKDLPAKPDIVLPKYNAVVLVHGCYWHRHHDCKYTTTPKSNIDFWKSKFEENIKRDARNKKSLEHRGWRVFTVWECELKDHAKLHSLINELKNG